MVYLGTSLGDLMLLDRNGKVVESVQVGESVRGIDFLHDGAHVLVGCKNRDLHVFETPGSLPAGAAQEVAAWVERLRNTPSTIETSTASLKGARVFISYASADRIFADVLEKKLRADGVLCWRDDHSLVAGRVDKQLQRAIAQNDVLIVVLSEASLASDWVRWELDHARTIEKTAKRDVICPVAIDRTWESWTSDPVLKREILKYHILHFTDWRSQDTFGEAYGRLVAGLRQNYLSPGPRA
jgi:hypothetical protein